MSINHFIFCLIATALVSCANTGSQTSGTTDNEKITTLTREGNPKSVVINSSMGSSDIKNWRVLDNYSMIIETYSHGDLLATFSQPCRNLRFSESIGFSTMGPFELDKFTKVYLPDGNWCNIKELVPYIPLDSNQDNE